LVSKFAAIIPYTYLCQPRKLKKLSKHSFSHRYRCPTVIDWLFTFFNQITCQIQLQHMRFTQVAMELIGHPPHLHFTIIVEAIDSIISTPPSLKSIASV